MAYDGRFPVTFLAGDRGVWRIERITPVRGEGLRPAARSARWWGMTQDERRAVFEERSRHIADSVGYLPRIARRLYHARDLGEPFDFLTWFELAPGHAAAFEELVDVLRGREEWSFVEREIDIRLARD